MFFVFDDAGDALDGLHHFRVGGAHVFGDEAGELVEVGVLLADEPRVTHGPAHDFAEDVAAAFIGGEDAIVNKEGGGAGVVGVDAEGGIDARVGSECDVAEIGGALHDGVDKVCVVIGDFALKDGGDTFEAHAGIDGRAREGRHGAGDVAVELHEDEVPDFDEATAAVEGEGFVFAAGLGGFGAEVVVDFRAGSAGAGIAHLPEVISFVEAEDAGFGDAGDGLPERFGFVVFAENGDVEAVFIEAVIFGDEVPGELDGVGFEVVAEGEIAEHFKERVVAAGVADVFEIVVFAAGADALLRGGGAGVVALFEALEDLFELVHAGVGEEEGGVVAGDQGGGADNAVSAGGEEVEEALADFVTGHKSPLNWVDSSIIGYG